MSHTLNKCVHKRNGAFLRVDLFRRHLRLMILLFALSLLCAGVYAVNARRFYYSTARVEVILSAPKIALNGAKLPAGGGISAAIKELQSPHLVERAARRFGLKASAREIQLKHGLRNEITDPDDGSLQIATWTTARNLAGLWPKALVEEYAADRTEKQERDRAEILDAYRRELKDAAGRMGVPFDDTLQIRSKADALRVAQELQMGSGSSADLLRLTKLIDAMGRVRIQLEDASLDAPAKLALITKVESELAAAATIGADPQSGANPPDATAPPPRAAAVSIQAEYQAAKKRFELEYQDVLNRRSEMEGKLGDSSPASPGEQRKSGQLAAQRARPNWERIASDLQKKLESLEERWSKESVGLTFAELLENRALPISPKLEVLALGSVGLGLLLALGVPVAIESLKRARHDLGGVESAFQLQELGFVPTIQAQQLAGATARNGFHDATIVENFRRIRTNLLSASVGSKAAQVTMVTSAMPKEGKTVVAANLALSFAREGERTLLIDADLQRGRVHRLFGFRQSPGLSNAIFEEVLPEQACRSTAHQNLSILTVGNHLETGAELVGSEKFAGLIASLRGTYDRIVLDAPPVLGLAEPGILQKHADGVLLVIWSEQTAARNVTAAIEALQVSGANFYGFVRSRPDAEASAPCTVASADSGGYATVPLDHA